METYYVTKYIGITSFSMMGRKTIPLLTANIWSDAYNPLMLYIDRVLKG